MDSMSWLLVGEKWVFAAFPADTRRWPMPGKNRRRIGKNEEFTANVRKQVRITEAIAETAADASGKERIAGEEQIADAKA